MTCTAHRTNGLPCKGQAITGAKVCRVHGGSAPQVRAAARKRIADLAAQLVDHAAALALKSKDSAEVLAAAKYLNEKADQYEPPPRADGDGGATANGFRGTFESLLVRLDRVVGEDKS